MQADFAAQSRIIQTNGGPLHVYHPLMGQTLPSVTTLAQRSHEDLHAVWSSARRLAQFRAHQVATVEQLYPEFRNPFGNRERLFTPQQRQQAKVTPNDVLRALAGLYPNYLETLLFGPYLDDPGDNFPVSEHFAADTACWKGTLEQGIPDSSTNQLDERWARRWALQFLHTPDLLIDTRLLVGAVVEAIPPQWSELWTAGLLTSLEASHYYRRRISGLGVEESRRAPSFLPNVPAALIDRHNVISSTPFDLSQAEDIAVISEDRWACDQFASGMASLTRYSPNSRTLFPQMTISRGEFRTIELHLVMLEPNLGGRAMAMTEEEFDSLRKKTPYADALLRLDIPPTDTKDVLLAYLAELPTIFDKAGVNLGLGLMLDFLSEPRCEPLLRKEFASYFPRLIEPANEDLGLAVRSKVSMRNLQDAYRDLGLAPATPDFLERPFRFLSLRTRRHQSVQQKSFQRMLDSVGPFFQQFIGDEADLQVLMDIHRTLLSLGQELPALSMSTMQESTKHGSRNHLRTENATIH